MDIPPGGASGTKTLYVKPVDRQAWLDLEAYARAEGLSVSQVVALLIRKFLRERTPRTGYL
jgi:hypothetical protein